MTTKTLTETQRAQLDFWTGFRKYAEERAERIRPTKPPADSCMDMAIGKDGFRLAAFAVTRNWDHVPEPEIRASLWVDGPYAARNFALLAKERDTIHNEYGEQLDWITKEGVNLRTIHLRRAVEWRSLDAREDCYRWLVKKLDRLHQVFLRRIRYLWLVGTLDRLHQVFRRRIRYQWLIKKLDRLHHVFRVCIERLP